MVGGVLIVAIIGGLLIVGFLGAIVLRGAAWIAARKLEVPFWRAFGLVLLCSVLNYVLNLMVGGTIRERQTTAYMMGAAFGNFVISLFAIYAPIFGYFINRPVFSGVPPLQPAAPPDIPLPQPPGIQSSVPGLPPPMIFPQAASAAPAQLRPIGYGSGVLVGLAYFGIWLVIGLIIAGLVWGLGSFIKF